MKRNGNDSKTKAARKPFLRFQMTDPAIKVDDPKTVDGDSLSSESVTTNEKLGGRKVNRRTQVV